MYLEFYCLIGLSCGSDGTESACNAGELGLIPGLGRSPGEENGNPLPVESHGQRSLVGYSPRGCKELDTTERLTLSPLINFRYVTFYTEKLSWTYDFIRGLCTLNDFSSPMVTKISRPVTYVFLKNNIKCLNIKVQILWVSYFSHCALVSFAK